MMTRVTVRIRGLWSLVLAAFAATGVLLALASPAAAQAETDCFNFVQGNIPWNYEGATTWSPTNVQNLCHGTTVAAEPGRCFDRVMTGGINWGGGTTWQWENALNLCKGTSNAATTISCFQGRIAAGAAWQTAIPDCNPLAAPPPPPPAPGPTAAETACFNFVQGNIPWNYEGATSWSPTNVQNLCRGTTVAAEPGRCFDRVMTGGISWGGGTTWQWENALNLCDGTSNATATVSCFQGKIGAGVSWPDAIAQCDP
jgi:hypothetical protein